MLDLNVLRADAELGPEFEFREPAPPPGSAPEAIFLTGATDFLGAYLLDELLRETQADIYCLVRSTDPEAGLARLEAHLQTAGLWREADARRIVPVSGDLAHPRFGLADPDYQRLAERIDSVFHNGAWINAFLSYADLKTVNVEGTREILRFAGTARTKPFHYISTLALFFSHAHANRVLSETDEPLLDEGLRGGYKQTKWVAERLVRNAAARGLPSVVYRPGRIFGHSRTGFNANLNDVLCTVLKGCLQLGKYPDESVEIDITPVDYVSRGIVHLAKDPKSLGRIFHFCNPKPIAWNALMALLRELGHPLEGLPYSQWVEALKQHSAAHPKESFYRQLRLLMRSPIYLFSHDKPSSFGTETARRLAEASILCPPLDKDLMAVFMGYFQRCGYLQPIPGEPIEALNMSNISIDQRVFSVAEVPDTVLMPPLEQRLYQLTLGNSVVQAIHAAAELNIAGLLVDGPRYCDDLAQVTGTQPGPLYRVLRFLARFEIFAETAPGCFGLTPMAEILQDEHPHSLRKYILFRGAEAYAAVGKLLHSLKTGESAFKKIHGVDRAEYLKQHPERARLFSQGMSAGSEWQDQALTAAYDFSTIERLVNLGGVDRTHVVAILQNHPGMKGRFLEQAHSIETTRRRLAAAGVLERCELVTEGSVESVLVGADACLISAIHRLRDEEAIALIRRCRGALKADGRLLIIEKFVTAKMPWTVLENDLTILVSTGSGRLRTPDEFAALLAAGGFTPTRWVPIDAAIGLVEARTETS
jgi:thioester reductase-like protein